MRISSLLWLCYWTSFLSFFSVCLSDVPRDDCGGAQEFTAASIDCDNVRLNWISSDYFEAVEARLFVSCQSINDSEVTRTKGRAFVFPQATSVQHPLSAEFSAQPGEVCSYRGCLSVTDEFNWEASELALMMMTCTGHAVGDNIAWTATLTGDSITPTRSESNPSGTVSFVSASSTNPSQTTLPAHNPEAVTSSVVMDTISLSTGMLEVKVVTSSSERAKRSSEVINRSTSPQPPTSAGVPVSPGLLPVLAPMLAVLTVLLLSLLATLAILYLVNAHRVAALRKKRTLGYYIPPHDNLKSMDHILYSPLYHAAHHSSTSSIITALDPFSDSCTSLQTSPSKASTTGEQLFDPSILWSPNSSANLVETSGDSSGHSWSGYLAHHNTQQELRESFSSSCHSHTIQAAQDCPLESHLRAAHGDALNMLQENDLAARKENEYEALQDSKRVCTTSTNSMQYEELDPEVVKVWGSVDVDGIYSFSTEEVSGLSTVREQGTLGAVSVTSKPGNSSYIMNSSQQNIWDEDTLSYMDNIWDPTQRNEYSFNKDSSGHSIHYSGYFNKTLFCTPV